MKTVGEFKKAGLEFIDGDYINTYYGNKDQPINCSGVRNCNGSPENDDKFIIEFAWRKNTGVKPEFKGVIEFTFNGEGCEMQEVRLSENVNWGIVKKWRPSLNQPHKLTDNTAQQVEVIVNNNTPFSIELAEKGGFSYELKAESSDKPIFTQAITDEYIPQSGCECEIMLDGHWQKCFIVGLSKKGNPVIEIGAHCVESVGCKYRAIDTRTDREKAIDAALALDEYRDGLGMMSRKDFVGKLYDAGLLKCYPQSKKSP